MTTRRSRRNVAPVSYNARNAAPIITEKRLTIIDDEDESLDEFPEEQDDQEDGDVEEVLEDLEDEVSELDEELSELEEDEDEISDEEPRRKRPSRRPVRRKIPQAIYREDVPWKSPIPGPDPDPAELRFHPAVGWLVIYMGTFQDSFADLGGYGPQDIEDGVLESNVAIHKLFARILGLVLNRKKEIEYKRYVSALQELHSQLANLGSLHRLPALQWKSQDVFDVLTPLERLEFLHLLAQWSLQTCKTLQQQMTKLGGDSIICYTGFDDDYNRYYFCKGIVGDTRFRLYRESNPYLSVVNWTPVASDCDELEKFSRELDEQKGELSQSLVQILVEFLPIARESEERRLKEERRARRHHAVAREAEIVRSEPRESRRTRARRVDYSMFSYDEEFERRVTKKRTREDKEWGDTPPSDTGARQSRRLRGTAPEQGASLEEVEALAKARAMGLVASEPTKTSEPSELIEPAELGDLAAPSEPSVEPSAEPVEPSAGISGQYPGPQVPAAQGYQYAPSTSQHAPNGPNQNAPAAPQYPQNVPPQQAPSIASQYAPQQGQGIQYAPSSQHVPNMPSQYASTPSQYQGIPYNAPNGPGQHMTANHEYPGTQVQYAPNTAPAPAGTPASSEQPRIKTQP